MSTEIKDMEQRYAKRNENSPSYNSTYSNFMVKERNKYYTSIIRNNFRNLKEVKILEIGAGSGGNISFFKELGIPAENIYANELLSDRVEQLKQNHPDIHILSGDACEITENNFDIIFQSTVFTSILDEAFREKLANKMWSLLKMKGIILWYDFIYNNPKNPDVKKVSKKDLMKLFPKEDLIFSKKVTLAPPIGRRVGKAYQIFNLFSFLRSHLIAVFKKK